VGYIASPTHMLTSISGSL